MSECGIYRITSPSGRVYIGQSKNISHRWNQYKYYYESINCKSLIYRSLHKYGYNTHKFEIIELCEESALSEREKFWIESQKTWYKKYPTSRGLNLHEGGNVPPTRAIGTKMSKEFCDNLSEKAKENHKSNPNMGSKGKKTKKARKIMDPNTGIVYHGLIETSKALKIGVSTVVRRIQSNKLKIVCTDMSIRQQIY